MVFLFHVVCAEIPRDSTGSLYAWGVATYQGWAGVDLFFVLSGFFILSTLLANEALPGSARKYLLARFFRVVPLYVFLLLGYFYLPPFIREGHLKDQLFGTTTPNAVYLVFGQGWAPLFTHDVGAGFVAVSWSLSDEVFLYAVAAAVVYRFRRRVAVLAALAAFSWLCRLYFCLVRHEPSVGFFLPLCRMDEFMMGGMVAVLLKGGRLDRLSRFQTWAVRTGVGAGLAWFVGTTLALADSKGSFAMLADLPVLGLFFSCILILIVAGSATPPAPVRRSWAAALVYPLSRLGVISYSVYLFHMPLHLLFNYGCGLRYVSWALPGAGLRFVGECAVTLAFCCLTYLLIERPMIRVGHRLSRHRPSPLPPRLAS